MARRRRSLPQTIREAVVQRSGGRCANCGKIGRIGQRFGKPAVIELELSRVWYLQSGRVGLDYLSMEFDHITPLSRGGDNSVANMRILCRPCNRKRGAGCR